MFLRIEAKFDERLICQIGLYGLEGIGDSKVLPFFGKDRISIFLRLSDTW